MAKPEKATEEETSQYPPTQLLIASAQEILIEFPPDSAHDLGHHWAVFNNVVKISCKESIFTRVDIDALSVAIFWHDVERNQEGHKLLEEAFKKYGTEKDFTEKVIDIIDHHSFGTKQNTIEDKILWDADKLEYASLSRLEKGLEAYRKGNLSQEQFLKYKKEWLERIPSVRESFHFESSKKEFYRRMLRVIDKVMETPELSDMLIFLLQ